MDKAVIIIFAILVLVVIGSVVAIIVIKNRGEKYKVHVKTPKSKKRCKKRCKSSCKSKERWGHPPSTSNSPIVQSQRGAWDRYLIWSLQPAVENNTWMSVTYGGGKFVAVGSADGHRLTAVIAVSDNGITWDVQRLQVTDIIWYSVIYGNGKFVILGKGMGGNSIMTSTTTPGGDLTWNTIANISEFQDMHKIWSFVTYGGGKFVAIGSVEEHGYDRSTIVADSVDGINWNIRRAAGLNIFWYSAAYGNGKFVVIGNGLNGGKVMTSSGTTDDLTWGINNDSTDLTWGINNDSTVQLQAPNTIWTSITYGNEKFVAVGRDGPRGEIGNNVMTSSDGINWDIVSNHNLPIFQDQTPYQHPRPRWDLVTYGNGKFAAIVLLTNAEQRMWHTIVVSSDGINWTTREAPETPSGFIRWKSMTYGEPNGLSSFIAVGGIAFDILGGTTGNSGTSYIMSSSS